jgi:hypothetical protein
MTGIPVQIHETEKVYVPELVMGYLLTGSNFDDKKAKVTGGRNGFGAKLTNIFSTSFEIETADAAYVALLPFYCIYFIASIYLYISFPFSAKKRDTTKHGRPI